MACAASIRAADNELTPDEKEEGWQLLFDGKDLGGWKNSNGRPMRARIENGAINPHRSGGYLLVHEKPARDFALRCDVRMSQPKCNSGIFVRVGDLDDPVQTGIEVQISEDVEPSLHGFAAFYDLVPPTKNATRGADQWNTVEVRCKGSSLTVLVNGQDVNSMNVDEWTEPGRRPDGSRHKFRRALKDFPREGHFGFQDHGHDVWYKNIKLKPL